MNINELKSVAKAIDNITPKGIEWLKEFGNEGHSIWKADSVPFDDLGLDEKQQEALIQTFESDTSDPKSTIFKDGQIVKKVEGVHSLTILSVIARNLGVGNADGMLMGRGNRARALTAAILGILDPK